MTHLPYTINLICGDPSNDGHGQTSAQMIYSNLTLSEIEEAYTKGVAVIGLDVSADVASEYEDRSISDEAIELLKKAGFDTGTVNLSWLDTEAFELLYLFTVKCGNLAFKYKFAKGDRIYIGGYGLFT